MREIKFRAWKNNKRIADIRIMYIDEAGLVTVNPDVADCVEQYTCLKDKNGREIYEGDIVRFDVVASDRGPGKPGQTGIVQDVPRYGWGIGGYSPAWIKNEEVIGNIHENPELLNEAV